MKDTKSATDKEKNKYPDGIPELDGYLYYGMGPLRHQPDDECEDVAMWDDPWLIGAEGSETFTHYAIRAGSELARLNGLEPDNDLGDWKLVSEVGWPKEDQYPVWVWHPEWGIAVSFRPYDEIAVCFTTGNNAFKEIEDHEIRAWQSIKRPSPPVMSRKLTSIRDKEETVETAIARLESRIEKVERGLEAMKEAE